MITKYIFRLKKQDICLELQLQHLLTGINRVKSILLELHPDYDSIIRRIFKTLLVAILVFRKKGKLLTVELVQKNNRMTLKDKKIFLEPNILIMSWLKMSVQGLIGKEKVLKPFWNQQCLEISQRLWLPTETDSVDSVLNSSSGYLKGMESNSLSWIETNINPQTRTSQMTSFPSYMFIHADKWEKEDIRCRKIRIYPNQNQKKIFKNWIGASRYVYNRALSATKNGEKNNFYKLRNKYVIKKNNPIVEDWETETPKDIRAEAINDMTKAYKTALTNLKNNNINHFKLRFRSKKKESSIAIPNTAIQISNNKIFIYKSYTKVGIKLSKDKSLKNIKIDCTCRLKNDNGKWFLYIPITSKLDVEEPKNPGCALDPGTRKFQTVYSEDIIIKIGVRKECIKKLQERLDNLQSLRSKKNISKSHYNRRNNSIQFRLKNLVDELHYQTISYLTKTFKSIFIPTFESQELVKINKSKKFRRDLLSLRHFVFKQRLISKSKLKKGCSVHVCTEEYTSKTCGMCGFLTDVGSKEIYTCKNCNLVIDRDVNGARNIFIKQIKESQEISKAIFNR